MAPHDETTMTAGPAVARVNGVRIAYESTGSTGPPLVLVHGSWDSRHDWGAVVPGLAERFRVVSYDRRGHSDSECPPGQGSFTDDVADLAALIEHLRLAPAWVVGNSAGAVITLQLAAARPDVLRGIIVHEPPLFSLLAPGSPEAAAYAHLEAGPLAEVARRIAAGDHAGAAEQFVEEVALGPGAWEELPEGTRQTLVHNAPTFLDEQEDPGAGTIDEAALTGYRGPVLVTSGDQSPPVFAPVLDRLDRLLPQATRLVFGGAGHVPHVTHPEAYVHAVVTFASGAESTRS